MTRVRFGLGGLGALVGLYGAYVLLTRQNLDQLLNLALWLASGVIVHDAILAPVVLALAFAFRSVPDVWRRPATVALVVVGALSVVAMPVIGRFGARTDNATLLDRPYAWTWLVLVVLSVALVLVVGRLHAPRPDPTLGAGGEDGDGAGGR